MSGLERSGRDFMRPPITGLRLVQPAGPLADNAEIVQCVREIRVARTELGFLEVNGLAEQPFRGLDIAGGCRLFCGFEDGLRARGLRHVRWCRDRRDA